jgi:hypothetical protein
MDRSTLRIFRSGGFSRIPLLLVLAILPAAARNPTVRVLNASRPLSGDFQIGDRFEILIAGEPNQPVSVRTSRQGRTDWSPIIGSTDSTGRWSTGGQFEKADFGDWREIWTLGGTLADPAIQFSVNAPCLPGGPAQSFTSGPNTILSCQTPAGTQTFQTPSLPDPFRTPDGRLIPGRPSVQTPQQYHAGIIQYFITGGPEMRANRIALQSSRGGLGDETADLISNLIGVNALSQEEMRNSLAILRAAFEKPETIQPSARQPARTLLLLRHWRDSSGQEILKREIAETIAYLEAR